MSYSVSVTRSGGGAVVVSRSDSGVKVVVAGGLGTLVSVAQAAAGSAEDDAAVAAASALAASGSASAAASSATDAQTAQTAAELAETHAETAETNAETAQGLAEAAQAAAEAAAASITLPLAIATGGTATRTVADHFGDILNVRDFGATGDGETDDTAAFAAALATGSPVYVPPGDYVIASLVSVDDLPVRMFGRGARLVSGADALAFMFAITDAPAIEISGIEFDADAVGKGFMTMTGCVAPVITDCSFHSFKSDAVTAGLYHAIRAEDCPGIRIENNRFYDIGQAFGGSGVQPPQYRAISLNSGCDRAIVVGNDFNGVFQPVVFGEYPHWTSGMSYSVNDRVFYPVGDGTWDRWRCIQAHTASGANDPPDAAYWSLSRAAVWPIESVTISGNGFRNTRDNSIYALDYVKSVTITGNSFVRGNDEDIVVSSESVTITGNTFHNNDNRTIAVELGTSDMNALSIVGNTFVQDDANYAATNFVVFRNSGATHSVKALTISGNIFKSLFSISNASFLLLYKCDLLIIKGNVFDVAAGASERIIRLMSQVGRGIIAGNVFLTADALAIPIQNDGGGKLLISQNLLNGRIPANTVNEITQLSYFQDTGSNIYAKEPTSRIVWGDAAPTTGAWTRGDWVLNQFPSSGGAPGWVCTASGSPGTWKAMANLA